MLLELMELCDVMGCRSTCNTPTPEQAKVATMVQGYHAFLPRYPPLPSHFPVYMR